MTARVTILASGSAGNSALIDCEGACWLIDVGLPPKELDRRLALVNAQWSQIRGVLMTHRHSDHWHRGVLARCVETRTPLHCHRDHSASFRAALPEFEDLERQRLVRPYCGERPVPLSDQWHCHPIRVRHDGGPTFGFRFEQAHSAPSPRSFAYVADLGCWDRGLLERLQDVDLLAVEFNHDPELLKQSRRPPWLVRRILGDEGHLSNAQAAELVREVLKQSRAGQLRQLVLLHLSRECNSPELAAASARAALDQAGSQAELFTADQDEPSPTFVIGE